MKGYIHQLESFGSVDGPGVRFIIFFAGCPLRCKYCHNPDTWDMMKGKQYTADELLDEAITCREYWGTKGGITVSGGEPLAQIDFLLELFTKAKERGINTCIDTAGGPFTREGEWFEKFKQLMNVTDVLLMDIKHINEEEHIKLTGHTGKNIIEMFRYLDEINKPVWIRHVLVPGITDNDEYLIQTRDFIRTLGNVQRVEVLPYHGLGAMKYKDLGIDYVLKDTNSPTAERVQNAREILECAKYDGWKN
ncbi:MAG: pyruvate formate-lyase-activating protein [Treponema porcinum]|uniref:pyruvate formate-lyase-activating protein n=1 Tax=Treponema porcinum TaxID=261392 RepID=UPI002353C537|nr:pyruvate formate-lyase-activating protein [Treponema porcinum]MCI6178942.1 pyruvate formate-lyase-activating protein [Treponema porcinum]MCI6321907.1 pyruvate formate-lyase-activating protein [Treponema porcinum]MCI6815552.1 pyruvate formate-lyase-activating protein [Treponema porcinum]MCI6982614.1 pyruvate formate-lyase-activating protein [Treponema porcinum]MCI7533737.1 pyruvate formate-lyase-activating protein [Treponema porcinum]